MRKYKKRSRILTINILLLKTSLLLLAILITLAFAGVQPLASYKDVIVEAATNVLNTPGSLADIQITDVVGESTFVVEVKPNKDNIDFEETYCVVLMAKDGYLFSHKKVFWLASEFKINENSRTVRSNLNGIRILRLFAQPNDKAIVPMRQEISKLVTKKKKEAESDFLEFFWDGKSLPSYNVDELQARYTVSSSDRAAIAHKYVDVRIMTYEDYLVLKEAREQ